MMCPIPQRIVFAVMGFISTLIVYLLRKSMVLSMYRMENTTQTSFVPNLNIDSCPRSLTGNDIIGLNLTESTEYDEMYPFEWDINKLDTLTFAFYVGYVSSQFLGGSSSDQKGGKYFLGGGILFSSICTIIFPFMIPYGMIAAFIVRLLAGFGCGMAFPAIMAMMSQYVPPNERARIGATIYGGTYIGNIIGPHLAEFILKIGKWDHVFYIFGVVGLVWFSFWCIFCFNTPNTHPCISETEKRFLNVNVVVLQRLSKSKKIPWKAFLRCVPFWAAVAIFVGHEWGFVTITSYMLQYISETLNQDVTSAILLSSLAYSGIWMSSMMFAFLCDYYIMKNYHSISTGRKLYSTIAVTGSACCLIVGIYAGCNESFGLSMFILAMVIMGAFHSGAWINFLDIAPSYAGTMLAIADNIALNVTNLMPIMIGWLAPEWTTHQYRVVFWIFFSIMLISNVIYIVHGDAEQVWWDDVDKLGYPPNWHHDELENVTHVNITEENTENSITRTVYNN